MSEQGLLHNKAFPSPTNALQDLQDILVLKSMQEPTRKDEENSKETSKVGKAFLQWAQSQPSLLMDIPSTGAPNPHHLSGLLPT